MSFYLIVIGAADVLLSVLGILYTDYAWWQSVLGVVLATVGVIALDGLTAWLIRLLPERWFDVSHRMGAGRREVRFYRTIGIRRWKEKIPELGCFTNFSKSRVEQPTDASYLCRYIMECHYGVVIHLCNALVGALIPVCQPLRPLWLFALPVTVINAVLSLLPLFVLRYNLPKLLYLYERALRKSSNKETVFK